MIPFVALLHGTTAMANLAVRVPGMVPGLITYDWHSVYAVLGIPIRVNQIRYDYVYSYAVWGANVPANSLRIEQQLTYAILEA